MNKIEEFIKRNRYRNKQLYSDGMVENVDYVVCPVSKERLQKIKKNYIENVLGIDPDHYYKQFPNQLLVAPRHIQMIKKGLHSVDNNTGLTKYQLSQKKARITLTEVDSGGLTGDQRRGKKLKQIHMTNVDENGLNGYQRLANYRTQTFLPSGETIEQRAHRRRLKNITSKKVKNERRASKESKEFLQPILDWLVFEGIAYYFDNTEYGVNDSGAKKYYFYDLVIPGLQICIEYQSDAYHPDPRLLDEDWKKWKPIRGKKYTSDEKLMFDYKKAKVLYEKRGIRTFFFWSRDKKNLMELLCFMKTMSMKY